MGGERHMAVTRKPRPPAIQDEAFTLKYVLAEELMLIHGVDAGDGQLDTLYKKIHALASTGDGRSALCLSGGGIRSASFGLGVLQALARRNLLFKFHYLSTVSGGGYIGGWLSAWRRWLRSDTEVSKRLLNNIPDQYNEHSELSELRANSNYLTLKLGAMSADTWTLAALYIRNLLLNWLIFLPAILAVLLLPKLSHGLLVWATKWSTVGQYWCAGVAIVLLFFALAGSVSSRLEQHRVAQKGFLWFILLPTYAAALFLSLSSASTAVAAIGPGTGAVAGLVLYGITWLVAFGLNRNWSDFTFKLGGPDPAPSILLLLGWMIAGAIAGGFVGLGYNLVTWANIRWADNGHILNLITIFGVSWVSVSMFLAESIYLGATSYSGNGDVEREWLARSSGWFVVSTSAWAALAAIVLYAPHIHQWIWGVLAVGTGAGIASAKFGSSAETVAVAAGKRIESFSMTTIISVATVIFLAALAISLSNILPDALEYVHTFAVTFIEKHFGKITWGAEAQSLVVTSVTIAVCLALAFGFAFFVNVNRFSSHAMYRNRLIRGFLGAARGDPAQPTPDPEDPLAKSTRDPYTDFDQKDNVRMHKLMWPDPKLEPGMRPRLFHVVNMALNVVSGENRAWQERKAEPFAVTPKASGNGNVGFWRTEHYASTTGGLSLGTAIAISGAAASPNQGYHSSALVGLLMTLFNVRLGWWLGNPRNPDTAQDEAPYFGIVQIVQELFGLTTDKSKYIYLSDGGHFENLGIYEMVRRRCRLIVASDAGCDPDCEFEDLGNAVRKVWIDLGVQIDFEKIDIKKRSAELPGLYCAIGKIRYPELKDPKTGTWKEEDLGYLLYLKPGFRTDGSQPADVTAYGLKHPDFPHESTADQFFSESQMESYRSLGSHIIDVVFGPQDSPPRPSGPTTAMRPFWQHIEDYVRPKPTLDRKPGLPPAARVTGPGD